MMRFLKPKPVAAVVCVDESEKVREPVPTVTPVVPLIVTAIDYS
jgi:hypothetical protein